jgi:hypothetical protein
MSAPEEPLGVRWEAFFLLRAMPREEEAAFRAYLDAHDVPSDAGVQELQAHYGTFRTTWAPGMPLPEGRPSGDKE